MANEKLRHKEFRIPKDVVKELKKGFYNYEGTKKVEGYHRTRHLMRKKRISYELLKKVKHYFDNFEGATGSKEYKLNGGKSMKRWVEKTLEKARNYVKGKPQEKVTSRKLNRNIKESIVSVLKEYVDTNSK